MILHVTLRWQRQKVYQIDIRITTVLPSWVSYGLSVVGILVKIDHILIAPHCMLMNSSPPSATYMRQWTGSSLVQVVACRLFGAKPLPEPMLAYSQLDSWKYISVKLGILSFSLKKMQLKMPSVKMAAILSGGDELTIYCEEVCQSHVRGNAISCTLILQECVFVFHQAAIR